MKTVLAVLMLVMMTEGYKVLVVYPIPMRSLNNLGEGTVRHLLDAGHEVTFITCFPRNQNNPKLREIDLSDHADLMANDDYLNITHLLNNPVEVSTDIDHLQDLILDIAEKTFQHTNVKALLDNPKETFDAVVADYVETEIYAGFAVLYKCPMVWLYSMGAHWSVIRLVDDSTNPAYATDYITTLAPPYSFSQRFDVLWGQIRWRYSKQFKFIPKEKVAYQKYFLPAFVKRGISLPDYEDIMYNVSLVLSNEHLATGDIPSTPQNWKLVGGFHIQDPPKALPKNLQDIMDNAKHGVIYFSMGSVWRSELVPKELREGLLRVFSELKATVIWKYEADLKNLPENVHIVKWAPQQSILAHPNCKLFISHGGLLSSTEAIHFAVPTIGIPVSYDQNINIDKAVRRGYALMVKLSYGLPKDLKSAIQVMINDPKYKQKATELSAIYHDRPVASGKELVYWVEYVIRTKGAPHLKSPSLKTPFYQKAYLDIAAIVCASMFLVVLQKYLYCGAKKNKKMKRS